ncbi:MAG: TolC family protein [Sphingomonas sp.]|uniref:TolC family protein n=1 Tax=Sphingomonas sp. TaxID=28214 RepID=UPI001AC6ED81|nr:TolC family protein [Sphingomonas sp.]MBN8815917.1 TolC family protein [Sphingomonas sp.]
MKRHVTVAAALLLSACQSYAPAPLSSSPGLLAGPDAAALSRASSEIDRPYLTPVAIDLSRPLDANAVAILAVIANPDLKALRTRAGVSEAQVFAARLMPDPTLNLGVSKVLSGPDTMLDLLSALGLDINSLRTRGARIAQARSAAAQVRLDLAWNEWQAAGQARLQAARTVLLGPNVALANATRDSARSLLDRTLRAAGRGDIAGGQVQAAATALADAESKARTAETDLGTARFALSRLLGLPPTYPLALAPPITVDTPLDGDRLFALARVNRYDIAALLAGYQSQEAALRKAILDQFPTLNLTLTSNRDTAGNLIVGPSIDFTLPLWNRNRGGIAVEKATREALKAEYEARLFQTRSDIAAAVAGIELARRQRNSALRDLPSAQRYADASRRAARRGDLAAATAESAEQVLRDKQILLAQSEQAIAEQMIALELLTGTPREAWTQ